MSADGYDGAAYMNHDNNTRKVFKKIYKPTNVGKSMTNEEVFRPTPWDITKLLAGLTLIMGLGGKGIEMIDRANGGKYLPSGRHGMLQIAIAYDTNWDGTPDFVQQCGGNKLGWQYSFTRAPTQAEIEEFRLLK